MTFRHGWHLRRTAGQQGVPFGPPRPTASRLSFRYRHQKPNHTAGVTGDTEEPSSYARRFSPESNKSRDKGSPTYVSPAQELRILIAADVLSEGQNLQDAAIVVNFDLPWAIIRLIQRAGRVDRPTHEEDRLCIQKDDIRAREPQIICSLGIRHST